MRVLGWLGDQDTMGVFALDEVVFTNIGHDLSARDDLDVELIADFIPFLRISAG